MVLYFLIINLIRKYMFIKHDKKSIRLPNYDY